MVTRRYEESHGLGVTIFRAKPHSNCPTLSGRFNHIKVTESRQSGNATPSRQNAYLRRHFQRAAHLPGQGTGIENSDFLSAHATTSIRRLTFWVYRASSMSVVIAKSSASKMERPNLSSFSARTPVALHGQFFSEDSTGRVSLRFVPRLTARIWECRKHFTEPQWERAGNNGG